MKKNTFIKNLNNKKIKPTAIKRALDICSSNELIVKDKLSSNEINNLVEIAFTVSWLENVNNIDLENDDTNYFIDEIVESMLNHISDYLWSIIKKKGI
ncbi:hypothetical protein [Vibrio crassostreae]|uniref:hypothetical protein n=1 Tax=Vibrio crassostreae TaxID=246167 RepID=UPI00036B7822|nr:hypothetical protein [Vibrio crassostreae]OED91245.1 hypothetical protein A141_12335 [Vibrio crassostreae ZF-91]